MKTITDQQDVSLSFEEQPDQPEIWWRETVRMFCTNKAAVCGGVKGISGGSWEYYRLALWARMSEGRI